MLAVKSCPHAQTRQVRGTFSPVDVAADLSLEPGRTYEPLRILASGIAIDGQGATIDGAGFNGIGVRAEGVSNVTLRNVRVRGFNLGLHVSNGAYWLIEDCDFSDNFHDPDWGWEQHPAAGGILLEKVRH